MNYSRIPFKGETPELYCAIPLVAGVEAAWVLYSEAAVDLYSEGAADNGLGHNIWQVTQDAAGDVNFEATQWYYNGGFCSITLSPIGTSAGELVPLIFAASDKLGEGYI